MAVEANGEGTPYYSGCGEDEALLAAVRAVFRDDRGDEFVDDMERLIEEKRELMVQICKRNRLKVDSGVANLIKGREAMVDVGNSINDASEQANGLQNENKDTDATLRELVTIRANLMSTLAVVQSTKRLVRLRSRATTNINSGKLHAGMQLIGMLQKETALAHEKYIETLKARDPALAARYSSNGKRTFFSEVMPDPAGLANDVEAKESAVFLGFQSYLRTAIEEFGRYAMSLDECNGWLPELHEKVLDEEFQGNVDAPRLTIRPLLRCLLVRADTDRLAEFRMEYAKLRRYQLDSYVYLGVYADLETVESSFVRILGFFIAERKITAFLSGSPTLERYVGRDGLVPEADLTEWWLDGQQKLAECLRGLVYADNDERKPVKDATEKFLSCLRSYNLKLDRIEERLRDVGIG